MASREKKITTKEAVAYARDMGGFTIFNLLHAVTRLSRDIENADERFYNDWRARGLLLHASRMVVIEELREASHAESRGKNWFL